LYIVEVSLFGSAKMYTEPNSWITFGITDSGYSAKRTARKGRPETYSDDAIRCDLMIKVLFRNSVSHAWGIYLIANGDSEAWAFLPWLFDILPES
jgi:hypothetical protein